MSANVRPIQAAPVPAVPGQVSVGPTPTSKDSSASSLGGFPVNCLQKAGVFVQKIITTTDMVIPGTNSSTDVKARITAGESIHVIRGTKGTYIRTSDGRIFAIRAANKPNMSDENAAMPHKDPQESADEQPTTGSNSCPSPDQQQPVTPKNLPRSLSPDSPEIISELQRYTARKGSQPEREDGSKVDNPPSGKLAQSNSGSGNVRHPEAKRANVIQHNKDATAAQDLRISSKRKASTPLLDEKPRKQPAAGKHLAPSLASHGLPYAGGYGLPQAFNPAVLGGSLGHPLYMGAGLPFLHPSHSALGDPSFMPELFGLGTVPTSSSSSALSTSTATDVSSSSSQPSSTSNASTLAPGTLPPFMLSPSLSGMAGMLPPSFAFSYSQSLAGLYRGSMLPGGLPGPAATPGPAGASFLSQYTSTAGSSSSSSSSSSPSSFSPSAHSEDQKPRAIVNGSNISSPSSLDDNEEVI